MMEKICIVIKKGTWDIAPGCGETAPFCSAAMHEFPLLMQHFFFLTVLLVGAAHNEIMTY